MYVKCIVDNVFFVFFARIDLKIMGFFFNKHFLKKRVFQTKKYLDVKSTKRYLFGNPAHTNLNLTSRLY